MARIFLVDQLANLTLEHQERRVGTLRAIRAFSEEEAQLENALRGVRVLVGYRAAHRRGVNPNLFGHFLDHHRPEGLDAAIEELLLAAHNHFAGPQDCALALGLSLIHI